MLAGNLKRIWTIEMLDGDPVVTREAAYDPLATETTGVSCEGLAEEDCNSIPPFRYAVSLNSFAALVRPSLSRSFSL
jgi:hypothetical protein